jgi:hypothetical protein
VNRFLNNKILRAASILLAGTMLAGCGASASFPPTVMSSPTVMSATPAPTPTPTAMPTPVSTPVSTPVPTPVPTLDGAWTAFDDHLKSVMPGVQADVAGFEACLANTDCATATVIKDAHAVATDTTRELDWLNANPPDACYRTVYDNQKEGLTELGLEMAAALKALSVDGTQADSEAVGTHAMASMSAFDSVDAGLDAANTACGG